MTKLVQFGGEQPLHYYRPTLLDCKENLEILLGEEVDRCIEKNRDITRGRLSKRYDLVNDAMEKLQEALRL